MVAISIIRALVSWISEGMVDGPFTDSVPLVCSYPPVGPVIALAHVAHSHGGVGRIEEIVGVQTSCHLRRGEAVHVDGETLVVGRTRHPLGLVGEGGRPTEVTRILTRWSRLGQVPERRCIRW